MRGFVIAAVALASACASQAPQTQARSGADAEARCARLASFALAQGRVTQAFYVHAGPAPSLTPPRPGAAPAPDLPAYCRVSATLSPSSESDIHAEIWLPADTWNGKFMMVGNGGASGSLSRGALIAPLRKGYATATTDTGHTSGAWDMSWAFGHREKLIDFAWRAVHETSVSAKALVGAYYAQAPRYSYWNGCSSGGKQGLKEAQLFPEDFDGIIAGAPANNWVRLITQSTTASIAVLPTTSPRYIHPSKYKLLQSAALAACDKLDGVTDAVIEDPRACRFDPAVLSCTGDKDGPQCLTRAQIGAARKIYGDVRAPRTGAIIFPGLEPGSEPGWAILAAGPEPFPMGKSYFGNVVFNNPDWDPYTLDLDKDVDAALRADGGLISATSPDLSRFKARGGKMITYHGWADGLISPRNSIAYYEDVVAAQSAARPGRDGLADTQSFYRLFMVPGQGHCSQGGPGADGFDAISVIEDWVENGRAPDRIIAAHVGAGPAKTRPLCAYPRVARYNGAGDANDAANFTCEAR